MREDWIEVELGKVSELNPKIKNKNEIDDDFIVQFVPMKLVDEVIDNIHLIETRKFKEVQKKSYTYFKERDVLFAKVTPCMENGKIAIAKNLKNGIGYGSSEFHVFRCSENLNNQYLFFFIVQSKFRNDSQHAMTGAVGLRRVPKKFLEDYSIPLAPLPEQRAIVAKIEQLLSELDNGIANLKTAKDKLKIYRHAVLKKAFEGELTKEWREKNTIKTVDWVIEPLSKIAVKITDGEHFRPPTQEAGIYFLSAKDVQDYGVDFSSPLYISKETADKALKRCDPERGDILIVSRGATVGRMCIVNTDKVFCLLGSVILIKVNKELNSLFLTYVLKSPDINRKLITLSGSTAQQAIYLRDIKKIEVAIPTIKEQTQIVQEIETRLSVCDNILANIEEGLEKSEALRQSILKKAFEGKLLSKTELQTCRKEPDWEPAEKLLERIKKVK